MAGSVLLDVVAGRGALFFFFWVGGVSRKRTAPLSLSLSLARALSLSLCIYIEVGERALRRDSRRPVV
jgi:hypothetical protein